MNNYTAARPNIFFQVLENNIHEPKSTHLADFGSFLEEQKKQFLRSLPWSPESQQKRQLEEIEYKKREAVEKRLNFVSNKVGWYMSKFSENSLPGKLSSDKISKSLLSLCTKKEINTELNRLIKQAQNIINENKERPKTVTTTSYWGAGYPINGGYSYETKDNSSEINKNIAEQKFFIKAAQEVLQKVNSF